MSKITAIGLDLAKSVFQVHGADREGNPLVRRKLRRGQVLGFFADLPPCLIGMESCGGAHHWDNGDRALIVNLRKEKVLCRNYSRINDQYRVCFVWRDGHAYQVEITDYH